MLANQLQLAMANGLAANGPAKTYLAQTISGASCANSGASCAADSVSSSLKGFIDPQTLEKQKLVYFRLLDEQLKHAWQILDSQMTYQRQFLRTQASQQVTQFDWGIDDQVREQERLLSQRYKEQSLVLQNEVDEGMRQLEEKARQMEMEYTKVAAGQHITEEEGREFEVMQPQLRQHAEVLAKKLDRPVRPEDQL